MIDVERSAEAPASLAQRSSWRDRDVLEALHRDFLGKCYLCETPLAAADFEVDHRIPRALHPELEFEWTNLFPACDRCNGRRPTYPELGLLDPGDGVEHRLEQIANPVPVPVSLRCDFRAVTEDDDPARNTARELCALHDPTAATTFRARQRTRNLLRAIYDYFIQDVWPALERVERLSRARKRGELMSTTDLEHAKRALRTATSRRAPYTMLVRSLVGSALDELFD